MGGESKTKTRAARPLSESFAGPVVLGGLFAVGFYGLVAVMPQEWSFFQRYFCSHPLEYVTTGLFFVAMGTLLLKLTQLGAERAELSSDLARTVHSERPGADQLDETVATLSATRQRSWFVRRLQDTTAFVKSRQTADGIEDHLRYLGELAGDQLHRSYAFVRTITWAVPILGFLGTVIGITMAIANVTPEQLDSSLGEVTGGLAVAFDTTALALALSIVLVFTSFIVERSEQQLLADIEDFSMRHLPSLFGTKIDQPDAALQTAASESLAQAVDAFIERQTTAWEEQIGGLRSKWDEVLRHQTAALGDSLSDGMASTLASHSSELQDARTTFANTLGESLSESADRVLDGVAAIEERMNAWQQTMQQSSADAAAQIEAMKSQTEALLRIGGQQEQLAKLEDQLCSNLEAIRISETFDQTLNNLTAAVHLLSARAGSAAKKAA